VSGFLTHRRIAVRDEVGIDIVNVWQVPVSVRKIRNE